MWGLGHSDLVQSTISPSSTPRAGTWVRRLADANAAEPTCGPQLALLVTMDGDIPTDTSHCHCCAAWHTMALILATSSNPLLQFFHAIWNENLPSCKHVSGPSDVAAGFTSCTFNCATVSQLTKLQLRVQRKWWCRSKLLLLDLQCLQRAAS